MSDMWQVQYYQGASIWGLEFARLQTGAAAGES